RTRPNREIVDEVANPRPACQRIKAGVRNQIAEVQPPLDEAGACMDQFDGEVALHHDGIADGADLDVAAQIQHGRLGHPNPPSLPHAACSSIDVIVCAGSTASVSSTRSMVIATTSVACVIVWAGSTASVVAAYTRIRSRSVIPVSEWAGSIASPARA